MIVVSVMSVLTLGVVLGFGGGQILSTGARSSDPARHALALEQAVEQGRDLALFTRQPVGLHPLRRGWAVVLRDASGAWVAQRGLSTQVDAILLEWQVNARAFAPPERAGPNPPAIRLLGDGRTTPFTLRISPSKGSGTAQLCSSTEAQRIRCDPA